MTGSHEVQGFDPYSPLPTHSGSGGISRRFFYGLMAQRLAGGLIIPGLGVSSGPTKYICENLWIFSRHFFTNSLPFNDSITKFI